MEAARPATSDDLAYLVALAGMALEELAPTRGGTVFVARESRAEPLTETFEADLADPSVVVLTGTIDDHPVGYAVGRTERLRDATLLGVVSDLFVEAGARSVGVGEALMADLLAWFGAAGCAGVDATALPGNRATKNFFEISGFSARLIVMHHKLAGAGG